MPVCEIASEAHPLTLDVGPRLFKSECEPAEQFREFFCAAFIVISVAATCYCALQQKAGGVLGIEDIESELHYLSAKIGHPAGNQHVPASKFWQQGLHRRCGGCVINVVEDQEPARISLEPVERCADLLFVVSRLPLWQL